jgi:hypothetical protein
VALGNGRLSKQPDTSSVLRDTAQNDDDAQETEPTDFGYSPSELAAIDGANKAFAPIIKAIDTLENIEAWVPPVVKGVRAFRDRAMRETGALNYLDHQYRKLFRKLLSHEPIGPWLLDEHRRSLLDAVHYLGSNDSYLDAFLEWRRTKITENQRRKWRSPRTLVDHFKRWQSSVVPNTDRRTTDQKAIERVRAEGHKADAARIAEVEQARREFANRTIATTDTFWAALRQAGPEKFVQALREHDAKDYARAAHQLLGDWLKEPTS